MRRVLAVSVVVFAILIGVLYGQTSRNTRLPSTPVRYQRFVPLPPESRPDYIMRTESGKAWGLQMYLEFALDTETGQLCKSFPWNVPGKPYNEIPVCHDLINQ